MKRSLEQTNKQKNKRPRTTSIIPTTWANVVSVTKNVLNFFYSAIKGAPPHPSPALSLPPAPARQADPLTDLTMAVQAGNIDKFKSLVMNLSSEDLYHYLLQRPLCSFAKATLITEILAGFDNKRINNFLLPIVSSLSTLEREKLFSLKVKEKYDVTRFLIQLMKVADKDVFIAFLKGVNVDKICHELITQIQEDSIVREILFIYRPDHIKTNFSLLLELLSPEQLFNLYATTDHLQTHILHIVASGLTFDDKKTIKLILEPLLNIPLLLRLKLIFAVNGENQTFFHISANFARIDLLLLTLPLLETSDNIYTAFSMQDDYGFTPLHYLARFGNIEKREQLIEQLKNRLLPQDYEKLLAITTLSGKNPTELAKLCAHDVPIKAILDKTQLESEAYSLDERISAEIESYQLNTKEFNAARFVQRKYREKIATKNFRKIAFLLIAVNKDIHAFILSSTFLDDLLYLINQLGAYCFVSQRFPDQFYEIFFKLLKAIPWQTISSEDKIKITAALCKIKKEKLKEILPPSFQEIELLEIAPHVLLTPLSLKTFIKLFAIRDETIKLKLVKINAAKCVKLLGTVEEFEQAILPFIQNNDRFGLWKFSFHLFSKYHRRNDFTRYRTLAGTMLHHPKYTLPEIANMLRLAWNALKETVLLTGALDNHYPRVDPYDSTRQAWALSDKKITIQHGGGLFYLFDFISGKNPGYALERKGCGIQVAPIQRNREEYYAMRNAPSNVDIPVRLSGEILPIYLDDAPNRYEAGLRPQYLPYLENIKLTVFKDSSPVEESFYANELRIRLNPPNAVMF